MLYEIILKAMFWQVILAVAIKWCRFCRRLHTRADNLCLWLARKCEGEPDPGSIKPDEVKKFFGLN